MQAIEKGLLIMRRNLFPLLLLVIFCAGGALAQTAEKPSIALLSFGTSSPAYSVGEYAILLMLQSNGFISGDAFELENRADIEGEGVRVFSLDANWELDRLGIMIETALDRGADVLVAFTTPVAQAALNATADMEDPPAVIFGSVHYPFEAGLADAPCLKPAHVTGAQILPPYAELLAALQRQSPDLTRIGIIYSLDQIAGIRGAQVIAELAESAGLDAAKAGVRGADELLLAVDSLASKGAEALVLPIDTVTSRGLPIIAKATSELGLPVYYPSLGAVHSGATISTGYYRQMDHGLNIGRMLAAHLNGQLDIAATAIDAISGDAIGLNLDSAETLEMEIDETLSDAAHFTIADGQALLSPTLEELSAELGAYLAAEDREDIDRQYLDSLHCTDAMIAEQRAQLETQ